jgi:hypothetical protein
VWSITRRRLLAVATNCVFDNEERILRISPSRRRMKCQIRTRG